ncbi:hypothetical protein ACHAW5_004319 [Stephanodiscus triporus]|uniref:Uncharacterized protein n=1 Tax=Stephanodiscus triporus TaxID=2934178 RepID=A0ABD3MXP2_9STRA
MSANSDVGGSRGIRIVGRSIKVVEHDGLTVLETIGNVATQTDGVSLALVTITKPTSEPWLTLHYDEYMHVTEGYEVDDAGTENTVTTPVREGQTAFIPRGSRFRPVFPAPAKYIPLCVPAFSPGRCVREEEEEGAEVSDVSARLNELHRKTTSSSPPPRGVCANVRLLYHMCRASSYEGAVSANAAYFPPTFVQDGRFTHATAVPSTLISTANHFYADAPPDDDWICLELDREVLEKRMGIVTIFERAAPVGDIDTDKSWDVLVPHIYGGIPVHVDGVVTKVYKMNRSQEDGTFLGIDGLV